MLGKGNAEVKNPGETRVEGWATKIKIKIKMKKWSESESMGCFNINKKGYRMLPF